MTPNKDLTSGSSGKLKLDEKLTGGLCFDAGYMPYLGLGSGPYGCGTPTVLTLPK